MKNRKNKEYVLNRTIEFVQDALHHSVTMSNINKNINNNLLNNDNVDEFEHLYYDFIKSFNNIINYFKNSDNVNVSDIYYISNDDELKQLVKKLLKIIN